ncbi:substrate-binding domain-containing protein [Geminicoccus harenae]|uniref:helix-turn-helix transcriptional regulator n=1 Tax=Geminicoccus harenae TaxID=2498453 RepID=UPI00168A83E2|nr:substrate-binding domain-containing protein [Geminicoccus harenae]
MRVALTLAGQIELGGRQIGLGPTMALLEGIATDQSVRGAALRLGLSYRSAWGRLAELEAALGQPVAVKTKGHGSMLTPLGTALRDALAAAFSRSAGLLAEEERALQLRLTALTEERRPSVLLAVSHDPLLLDILTELDGVEVAVAGSLEAARRLLAGSVDAAGFHGGGVELPETGPLAQLRAEPTLSVIPLFRREQGLILAAGNPLGIQAIGDLARAGLRFVNRQKDSGTRLWLDRLLARAGVSPAAIQGYEVEEFTHQAVAALVASGAADAGMGARASAERFGLDFLPLGEETYFLAVHHSVPAPLVGQITEAARERSQHSLGYAPAEGQAGRSR